MGIILWNLKLEMARSFVLTSSPIFELKIKFKVCS